jgi:hypothetical protein
MVRRYMRHPKLLIMLSLAFTSLALAAQKTAPASPDFLPEEGLQGGTFLFERGTSRPTHMDFLEGRPVVKSPDGRLGVTVTGPKESYGAWVTISPSTFPDGPVQVWPMQASVSVLWRRDSQAFALTDKRYADHSFVLVCGTEFRMGESGPDLGVAITDLTPIVGDAFKEHVRKYYETDNYEALLAYAMALRWVGNDNLLIGVNAKTWGPHTFPNRGINDWYLAYLVDVPNTKVLREVGKDQLLSEYKIKVAE